MAEATVDNLPELFDPVLDYLFSVLPTNVYDTIELVTTQGYHALSSIFSLVRTLASEAWDIEKILPPLITLLAAYLALVSFYRTSAWMIRTAFAFVKWGFILTTLGTAAGYFLANANVGGAEAGRGLGNWGLASTIGGLLSEYMNGPQAAPKGTRPSTRSSSSSKKSKTKARPKAYDSWDKQRQWQYSEAQEEGQSSPIAEAQKAISDMLGKAGRVALQSGWWEAAQDAGQKVLSQMGGDSSDGERQETRRKRKERNTRSR
ncbi:hypothetical protein BDW22DRAFT_1360448 [Trametopsis cervina]|nr:hypothetical protein BDW22DRAFT_1360448 [Trametopsis cervina]